MGINESVKRIIREFGGERDLYRDDEESKRIIWKMAKDLVGGSAVDFTELAGEGAEDFIVFYQYRDSALPEDMKSQILERIPQQNDYNTYSIVVLTETFEKKAEVKKYARKIRNAIKKKIGCMLSQISFQVLSYYSGEEHRFVIDIGKRVDVIEIPDKTQNLDNLREGSIAKKITAYTYSASLYDIVNMYNQVGDELFQRNVRYGINDQLEVEKSIKETLRNNPENFWFLNNGITITVQKKSALNNSKNSSVILDYNSLKFPEVVSVINGAQTITTAAEFWYDDIGSKDENAEEIRERARKQARVLLRIMCVNEDRKDCQAELDQISISLNRQKPIKGEDIAYTSPLVLEINQLFKADDNDDIHFYITKRGEQIFGKYQYSLTDFARTIKAYRLQKPGEARTQSSNKILDYISKNVGPDYTEAVKNEDAEQAFQKYFKPTNFAMKALSYYREAEKRIAPKGEHDPVILGNGGYYFVAYLIYVLYQDSSDYTDFAGKTDQIDERLDGMLRQYLEVLNDLGDEYVNNTKKPVDSNTFKNEELYYELTEYKNKGTNRAVQKKVKELEEEIKKQLL